MVENVVIPEYTTSLSTILWLLVTVLMPLLVGLITRPSTKASVQSLLLLVASVLNGYLSEALETGARYNWTDGTLQFVVSLVMAIAIHYGVWKPLGATQKALSVGASANEKRVV